MLVAAPRFSKYLHGTAALFTDTVEKMPFWFLGNEDGSISPATWAEMAAQPEAEHEKVFSTLMFLFFLEQTMRWCRLDGRPHQNLHCTARLLDLPYLSILDVCTCQSMSEQCQGIIRTTCLR